MFGDDHPNCYVLRCLSYLRSGERRYFSFGIELIIVSRSIRTTNLPWKKRGYVTWPISFRYLAPFVSQKWFKLELSNFVQITPKEACLGSQLISGARTFEGGGRWKNVQNRRWRCPHWGNSSWPIIWLKPPVSNWKIILHTGWSIYI